MIRAIEERTSLEETRKSAELRVRLAGRRVMIWSAEHNAYWRARVPRLRGASLKEGLSMTATELPVEETQKTISAWAEQTFGPVSSNVRVCTRALEECVEAMRDLSVDDANPKALEEAADTIIVLCRLADRSGESLNDIVRLHALPYGASTNLQLAAHAAQRLANACSALAIDDTHLPVKALADAAWCMEKLAQRMGSKLQDAINRKMAINRRRRWKLDGSGHGYHVRETEAA